jgi:hypothetical protein
MFSTLLVADGSIAVGTLLSSVVTTDANSTFYLAGAPYTQNNVGATTPSPLAAQSGVRLCAGASGCAATTAVYSQWPIRSLTLYNNTLWASKPSMPGGGGFGPIFQESYATFGRIGALQTLPTGQAPGYFSIYGSVISSSETCQAQFQNPTTAWLAVCGQTVSSAFSGGGLYTLQFTTNTQQW